MPVVATSDELLLQLSLEAGLVSAAEVGTARTRLAAAGPAAGAPSLFEELVRTGAIEARRTHELLSAHLGLATVDLSQWEAAADLRDLVPPVLARRYRLLPLDWRGEILRVAVADPLESDGTDALAHLLGRRIEPVVAVRDEFERALERYGGAEEPAALAESPAPPRPDAGIAAADADDREDATEADAPVITLVQTLIAEAVSQRASDIHLEPLERSFRVRYRIDGVLIPVQSPPKRMQAAIISRLKIMAGMNIAEKRLPQDGRIQFDVGGRPLDLRASSLPSSHGEGMVLRLLDQESLRLGLAELGFWPDDRAIFDRLIAQPDGIVLITGPTGSGKTTTLYSCLHGLNHPDRKIITVEDPVEYQLSGVNQVPVRAEVGMTFATALRAILRQAPNIVMVGEIRDAETAEIAMHASLTGHLVLSTLHTNDAPGAVTRLIDIGVKPFLVAAALRGVMAQRLVRRICPECSEAHRPTDRELRLLDLAPEQVAQANFRRGRGCPACHGTGYRGRVGIFEILVVDDALQELIHAGARAAKLRVYARAAGMRTLREDGVRKVIAGLTTVEEVVSITVGDAS